MDTYEEFAVFEELEAAAEEKKSKKKKVKKRMKSAKKFLCKLILTPPRGYANPTWYELRPMYKDFEKGVIAPTFEEVMNELLIDGLIRNDGDDGVTPQPGIKAFLES